jgi:pimeloyl-ACP methyl ester carboxylesterase
VVLLHGFPELAYTWRKQLLPLAQAGFHAIGQLWVTRQPN